MKKIIIQRTSVINSINEAVEYDVDYNEQSSIIGDNKYEYKSPMRYNEVSVIEYEDENSYSYKRPKILSNYVPSFTSIPRKHESIVSESKYEVEAVE